MAAEIVRSMFVAGFASCATYVVLTEIREREERFKRDCARDGAYARAFQLCGATEAQVQAGIHNVLNMAGLPFKVTPE